MGRYVIDASIMLQALLEGLELSPEHRLLAPTLIRSQVLDGLYMAVQSGKLPEDAGLAQLARFSKMKIRYLGDKVLQRRAWAVARDLGWDSIRDAEYIALAQLQADALVTLDAELASTASEVVPIATLEELLWAPK